MLAALGVTLRDIFAHFGGWIGDSGPFANEALPVGVQGLDQSLFGRGQTFVNALEFPVGQKGGRLLQCQDLLFCCCEKLLVIFLLSELPDAVFIALS